MAMVILGRIYDYPVFRGSHDIHLLCIQDRIPAPSHLPLRAGQIVPLFRGPCERGSSQTHAVAFAICVGPSFPRPFCDKVGRKGAGRILVQYLLCRLISCIGSKRSIRNDQIGLPSPGNMRIEDRGEKEV